MKDRLAAFAAWARQNISGDEKGEAQVFLDRLFQAFGQPGCKEIGGLFEHRIKKNAADGGGTAFADYVWKPVVLIEMKKRGAALQKHYRQAFDYWTRLVPNRPRYVILCNFDEFQIYDFETQMDAPVDFVTLEELPKRWGALNFLAPGNPEPVFGNDRVAVTRQAADCLAACFNHLVARKVDRDLAQRFTLQMLVSLFAEDIGLLPKYFVTQLLHDCGKPSDSYDLIGGLFRAMNTNPPESGGRYKGVQYFNGGLFSRPARVELDSRELGLLRRAAEEDWSKVQPEIFGTLFQHSMDAGERHAFGAHFTHPVDIMKIVGPTIIAPWRDCIESAKDKKALGTLLERLQEYHVLDPACGSGNFLYIAYRELKCLEARIYERMEFKRAPSNQARLSFLSARNFHGIDINPFAVEIAKVTMMIARKFAIDEFHITEEALPLDNLDANFIAADALITPEGKPAPWPKADVIIGNPPFLGAKRLKPEHGPEYVNALRKVYPEVPGMADFCVYWFRRAQDHLPPCTTEDPLAGRAGLVGTQNIRNNQSRVGGLDYIAKTGTIIEAVDNQPWSGEANVHVSIANWVKTQDQALLPQKRRLWFTIDVAKPIARRKRGQGSMSKEYDLNVHEIPRINSALSSDADVSPKKLLICNIKPKRCFQGKIPGYDGYVLNKTTAKELSKDSFEVISPYLIGRELLGDTEVNRWVIDFKNMNILQASAYQSAFDYCKSHVLPEVKEKFDVVSCENSDMAPARKEHLSRWWQFWNRRDELNTSLSKIFRYIGCSRVTRRPIMTFLSSKICPSDLVQVFLLDDDYSFGILQSAMHFEWFRKSSRMKVEKDLRYSIRAVFDTFPWPQSPTIKQIDTVAEAGREIRKIRAAALPKITGGLRALYRTLELPGVNPLKDAHAALDSAVLSAYGFSAKKDLLAQLLELNQQVAADIAAGNVVTAPGVPGNYPAPKKLITTDCIQAPPLA